MPVFATLGCTKMTIAVDSALIPIWFWRMKWKQIKWDYWHCSLCIKKFGFFFVFTVRNDSVLSCHTLCLLLLIKKINIYIYNFFFFELTHSSVEIHALGASGDPSKIAVGGDTRSNRLAQSMSPLCIFDLWKATLGFPAPSVFRSM